MVAVAEELSSRMVISERKKRIHWHKAPAHVVSFDLRTYPALIKLPSPTGDSASLKKRA